MSLRKILSIIGLSLLTSCATIKENVPIPTSDLFNKFLFLKIYGVNALSIGQDTDGDKYEDRIECYFRTKNNKESNFELVKVYEDADRNLNIEESELVWEADKGQEYDSRKKLVFLKSYVGEEDRIFFSVGYDTDNNGIEDSKEFYQVAGVDSTGHFTLVKVGADLKYVQIKDA
ncbi:MAG: hypothetical protein M1416_02690 [Candidatus Pacearchaeota archaeon]|nr:hypothetical protein [Candidatus Pacearchaeota archaeon]